MFGDNMGGVIISPNMKHVRERIDPEGNVINPETKELIEKNAVGYVPTKEEVEAKINLPTEPIKPNLPPESIFSRLAPPMVGIMPTIQEQIEQAKKHLADLELQKKEEIKRKKAELAALEGSE